MDCAIDGTVNEANREVLAFDSTGAAGVGSTGAIFVTNLVSGGAVFDAMTMGCFDFSFNFASAFAGLDSVFAIFSALAGFSALVGLTALIGLAGFDRFGDFFNRGGNRF